MHLPYPVLQAINYETGNYRVTAVDCVAAACKVAINASVMRIKVVKTGISKAFEIDGGPFTSPFCRVVEGHVHDDAYSCFVESFYHVAKFLSSGFRGGGLPSSPGAGQKSCGYSIPSSF